MIVFIRTIILYSFVVFVMRVMGKRQIGELQPFELVIAIMLSELAAVPMQDTGIPLIHGIIPIITLMALEIIISFLTLKFQGLRRIICGTPNILIKHGVILEDELRSQRFNLNDLLEELRLSGYLDIEEIEYAILENSGKLSIIPKQESSPVTLKDLNLIAKNVQLPVSLILDGQVIKKNMELSGYDINSLTDMLKKNNIHKVEDVFIAMLDSQGKLFLQRRHKHEA